MIRPRPAMLSPGASSSPSAFNPASRSSQPRSSGTPGPGAQRGPSAAARLAQQRRLIRESAQELLQEQQELEFRRQEVNFLEGKVNDAKNQQKAKRREFLAMRPQRQIFQAWKDYQTEASAMRKATPQQARLIVSAGRHKEWLERRVNRKARIGGRMLERCWVAWFMAHEARHMDAMYLEMERGEQDYEQLQKELEELTVQTKPVAEAAEVQAGRLRAATSVVNREVQLPSSNEAPLLVSRELLIVRRAEYEVRQRLLREEISELRLDIETFWERARPYVVAHADGKALIDFPLVAMTLCRVVLPLAAPHTAAQALECLQRATGADAMEDARAPPAASAETNAGEWGDAAAAKAAEAAAHKRPPLLPSDFRFAPGIQGLSLKHLSPPPLVPPSVLSGAGPGEGTRSTGGLQAALGSAQSLAGGSSGSGVAPASLPEGDYRARTRNSPMGTVALSAEVDLGRLLAAAALLASGQPQRPTVEEFGLRHGRLAAASGHSAAGTRHVAAEGQARRSPLLPANAPASAAKPPAAAPETARGPSEPQAWAVPVAAATAR